MKKMPCLFERTFHDRRRFTLHDRVTPGCEWALTAEGLATRKRDGTACMVQAGKLYKRYDAKKTKTGEWRLPPVGAIACDEPDEVTGHWPHWVPVGDEPESVWHREAWGDGTIRGALLHAVGAMTGTAFSCNAPMSDGTYELCGPRLQGNPEKLERHYFIPHSSEPIALADVERTFGGIRAFLAKHEIEGIVFHRLRGATGEMCKIRRADYGLPWGNSR